LCRQVIEHVKTWAEAGRARCAFGDAKAQRRGRAFRDKIRPWRAQNEEALRV